MVFKKNIDLSTAESFGDEWERFSQEDLNSDEANRRFEEYFHIFPWADLPKNAEGIDIGCGSGAKFENISNNFTPFGIDISEESANKADLSFKKRGGRAICSPATKVLEEFGENKFSGAILRSYLEHEHEPFEVLKNLKFTLKNDACVIIKVPNYDSVNRKIRKEKWCGFHFPDHVNQFTPKTLLKMVKDTNYEVLKFNFLDYLPTSDNMWMVVRPI